MKQFGHMVLVAQPRAIILLILMVIVTIFISFKDDLCFLCPQ